MKEPQPPKIVRFLDDLSTINFDILLFQNLINDSL